MNTRHMVAILNAVTAAAFTFSCSGNSPTQPTPNLPPSETEIALVQDYEQIFSERIPRPAYYVCGSEKVTTTAYLPLSPKRARLLTLYTSIDGKSVTRQLSSTVMPPAGSYRALVVIVRYPETFTDSALGLWQAAQAAISNDYATYTASKGRHGPLVTFEHTNVMMDPSQISEPASSAAVKSALEQQGRSLSGYDFLISLNLVPNKGEGGFSSTGSFDPAFIYMGNFGSFQAPLTSANMTSIAGAIYFHEVSHHWGWPGTHDWTSNSCSNLSPGYTGGLKEWLPAVLFGWEDVDGDGISEIVDPTPYGRSQ